MSARPGPSGGVPRKWYPYRDLLTPKLLVHEMSYEFQNSSAQLTFLSLAPRSLS